jgi:tetraacyldisaccharide 4'-kinase
MRKLLLPFSFLYWLGVAVRNWFFDIGILKKTRVAVPVISVGNISTGGVGKTPFVELVLEKLLQNRPLSVVSRGYGRKSTGTVVVGDGRGNFSTVEDSGDEPLQLAHKYPEAIVVADENRVRGALNAIELGARIILLDDGFQHRYLHRDVNMVILTVQEILKGEFMLPGGNRREPWTALKRADLIVVSRCADVNEFENVIAAGRERHVIPPGIPCAGMKTKLKVFKRSSSGEILNTGSFAGKDVVAFSGIGNPKSFEELLGNSSINVLKHVVYPDHHWYCENDIQRILDAGKQMRAEFIMTTEKDAERLNEKFEMFLEKEPVIIAEIRQEVIAGETAFTEVLTRVR